MGGDVLAQRLQIAFFSWRYRMMLSFTPGGRPGAQLGLVHRPLHLVAVDDTAVDHGQTDITPFCPPDDRIDQRYLRIKIGSVDMIEEERDQARFPGLCGAGAGANALARRHRHHG